MRILVVLVFENSTLGFPRVHNQAVSDPLRPAIDFEVAPTEMSIKTTNNLPVRSVLEKKKNENF